MTINMWIAALAWVLMVCGVLSRKTMRRHMNFMRAALLLDISLVLYLQFTREAIQTAASFKLSFFEQTHIGFSTCALLLYFPMMFLGYKLSKDVTNKKIRNIHRKLGFTTFTFRTLGFIFMFSMWKS